MIHAFLDSKNLVAEQQNTVVLRIRNDGPVACTDIVLRLKLPVQLLVLDRPTRFSVDRLEPGQSSEPFTLMVQPTKAGPCTIGSRNFSWLTADGEVKTGAYQQVLHVAESPQARLRAEALANEQAGRLREAWRQYWRLGQADQAEPCLQRAVAQLQASRSWQEAANECYDWAELQLQHTDGTTEHRDEGLRWLIKAADLYRKAQDDVRAAFCQRWADSLLASQASRDRVSQSPDQDKSSRRSGSRININIENVEKFVAPGADSHDVNVHNLGDAVVSSRHSSNTAPSAPGLCSWCRSTIQPKDRYCPNCGASLR